MNKNSKVLIKLIMLCSDDQWALDQRVMHRSIITGSAKCFPCLRTTVIFLQIPRTMLMAGHSSFRLSAKPFGFRRRSLSTSWIKSTILSFSPSSCSQASNALRKAIDYLKVLHQFGPYHHFLRAARPMSSMWIPRSTARGITRCADPALAVSGPFGKLDPSSYDTSLLISYFLLVSSCQDHTQTAT
jgi:hypothetical protein